MKILDMAHPGSNIGERPKSMILRNNTTGNYKVSHDFQART